MAKLLTSLSFVSRPSPELRKYVKRSSSKLSRRQNSAVVQTELLSSEPVSAERNLDTELALLNDQSKMIEMTYDIDEDFLDNCLFGESHNTFSMPEVA